MADTIESFVEKLKTDGVDAGKAEAAKVVADATAQSEQTAAEAQKQADRIVADAKGEAQRALEQGRNELELAARDVFNRLRAQLSDAIGEVLRRSAAEALTDTQFLTPLIHDVVVSYANQDADGVWPIEVRISDGDAEKVVTAVVKALGDGGEGKLSLTGGLKDAGFEYTVSGGVVEVTDASVAAALSEMIAPHLRELLAQSETLSKE